MASKYYTHYTPHPHPHERGKFRSSQQFYQCFPRHHIRDILGAEFVRVFRVRACGLREFISRRCPHRPERAHQRWISAKAVSAGFVRRVTQTLLDASAIRFMFVQRRTRRLYRRCDRKPPQTQTKTPFTFTHSHRALLLSVHLSLSLC